MRRRQWIRMAGVCAFALALGTAPLAQTAGAAGTANSANPAWQQDIADADIIDETRTGSITIHKYDLTAAEAAGAYKAGEIEATGVEDKDVENSLQDYAVEGVQFSYLRVGDVETHSVQKGNDRFVEIVYEIPKELADIIGFDAADAVDMASKQEANPCNHTGALHFTSQQLSDAVEALLKADNVKAKNALESYLYDYGTLDYTRDQKTSDGVVNLTKTDAKGVTKASNLELGLYLFVETEVPEQVVDTVNPWFVQLPFTNTDGEDGEGGERWLYDMTVYPKNQTGNPTIDKSVRNAMSEAVSDEHAKSEEFQYGDTVTASEGEVMDYIVVSKLPHITSQATYLSEYTFTDTLSQGLSYNEDTRIAFYDNAEDANENRTENAVALWDLTDGDYSQKYVDLTMDRSANTGSAKATSRMQISLTEQGLEVLNGVCAEDQPEGQIGFSDYYMVVYYTATVHSDESVILGDAGNPNRVNLIWSRTSDGYYNMLEDMNYVYTYGLDLTKTFSDDQGKFSEVEFKLYNKTDGYYLTAKPSSEEDGVYYITGKTMEKEEAATFIPNKDTGKLLINGLEGDSYQLTEVATDRGYNLLKEPIEIDITATDRDVIASVAGVTGMDAEAAEKIALNYNGGIYDENGNLVTSQFDELFGTEAGAPAEERANGRTIGATDLYVGEIVPASALVDNIAAQMTENDAAVCMTVNNTKGFLLPRTGGNGLYAVTIIGLVTAAGGCYVITRKRKGMQN